MNNTNSRYKIGIRGSGAMAEVDQAGLIHLGTSKPLRWVIAGDDRWYDPSADASVRQTTRDGFPIVVTKMRVPTGDVTTLAYCVADHGGVVVFEVRNESTLPFAVVLSDPAWRTVRNPVPMHDEITQAKMLAHVGFPTDAVIHPIGHQASLRFVYGAAGLLSREQIESLPTVDQVASGWEKALSGATRYNLPDHGIVKEANSIRAALLMGVAEQNDIADQVVATTESIRLGEKLNDVELNDYVAGIEELLKGKQRAGLLRSLLRRSKTTEAAPWYVDAVLSGATFALHKLAQHTAASDVRLAHAELSTNTRFTEVPPPGDFYALSPMKRLLRVDCEFARTRFKHSQSGVDVLPLLTATRLGDPSENWLGVNFEVHGLSAGSGTVGYAVRWHGERAAVLWEASDTSVLPVTSMANDPTWSGNELSGEVLLASPSEHQ